MPRPSMRSHLTSNNGLQCISMLRLVLSHCSQAYFGIITINMAITRSGTVHWNANQLHTRTIRNQLMKSTLFLAAGLMLTLAGCQSTQNGYSRTHSVQQTNSNEMNTHVFIDHDLNLT